MTTAIRKRLPRNDGLHKVTGTAKYAGGAPVIHEPNDDIYDAARNISRRTHPSFGDLQKGFAGADHVFEHTFETRSNSRPAASRTLTATRAPTCSISRCWCRPSGRRESSPLDGPRVERFRDWDVRLNSSVRGRFNPRAFALRIRKRNR